MTHSTKSALAQPVLLFDVGNTNIKLCLADQHHLGRAIPALHQPRNGRFPGPDHRRHLRPRGRGPGRGQAWSPVLGGASPVRPSRRGLQTFFSCPALFVPEDIPLPLDNTRPPPRAGRTDSWAATPRACFFRPDSDRGRFRPPSKGFVPKLSPNIGIYTVKSTGCCFLYCTHLCAEQQTCAAGRDRGYRHASSGIG